MSDANMSASPDELVDEIDKIRARLSGNIDELIGAVHPKAIAGRRVAKVKANFVDVGGNPRMEKIVPVVLGVVGVVATLVVTRRLFR